MEGKEEVFFLLRTDIDKNPGEQCMQEIAEHVAASVDRQYHLHLLQQAQMDLQNVSYQAVEAFNSRQIVQVCIDFQEKVRDILKRGYPASQWPNHLEPLPTTYLTLGGMYLQLNYAVGLEFLLKGTLYARDRRSSIWPRELLSLTKFIIYVAQADGDEIKWTAATKNVELLNRVGMRTVARGYACIVSLAGQFAFGLNSKFVRALYSWTGDIIDYPGDAEIHTDDFQQKFAGSQERLLTWACMNPKGGLSLPSPAEIAELKRHMEECRVEQ